MTFTVTSSKINLNAAKAPSFKASMPTPAQNPKIIFHLLKFDPKALKFNVEF